VITCSCGASVVRDPGRRGRMAGDLLEYCQCEGDCGSTTAVLVETCGHGAAQPEGDRWECPDCGHSWTQHGAPCYGELRARAEAAAARDRQDSWKRIAARAAGRC
jgi:hypothetical protein